MLGHILHGKEDCSQAKPLAQVVALMAEVVAPLAVVVAPHIQVAASHI